jgi:hypothetical protein
LPGLVTMQLSSIILPLWDAHRERVLLKRYSALNNSSFGGSSYASEKDRSRGMTSLEYHLEHEIEPLLQYAARREFTAENIVFLKAVRDLKRKWNHVYDSRKYSQRTLQELYEDAAFIYFSCVDRFTAAFNINIEGPIYDRLEDTFRSVRVSDAALNSPTSSISSLGSGSGPAEVCPFDDMKPFAGSSLDKDAEMADVGRRSGLPSTDIESVRPDMPVEVPLGFDLHVFDDAYKSVKYLVFTNTWQKYVFLCPPLRSPIEN